MHWSRECDEDVGAELVTEKGLLVWSRAVDGPHHQEVLVSHADAALTPEGRLDLARLGVENGWAVARAVLPPAERLAAALDTSTPPQTTQRTRGDLRRRAGQ